MSQLNQINPEKYSVAMVMMGRFVNHEVCSAIMPTTRYAVSAQR
jgi:hypothetical protein